MSPYETRLTEVQAPWGTSQHLVIRRKDGKPIRCGWDTLQKIKNEVMGEDVLAVEVFPEVDQTVDEANWRHFWSVPREIFPIGLTPRF